MLMAMMMIVMVMMLVMVIPVRYSSGLYWTGLGRSQSGLVRTWTAGNTVPQLDFQGNWAGVSASVSASVECEHEHIVIIDSLLDLYEHGGDTDAPTIVNNTTALGLQVEIRQ
jgi:hypothetical protein